MTQDERWNVRYEEVKKFIESNHRNPSKYAEEERRMLHFLKRGRKLINAGELKEPRLSMFKELMALCELYRHKNQYALGYIGRRKDIDMDDNEHPSRPALLLHGRTGVWV